MSISNLAARTLLAAIASAPSAMAQFTPPRPASFPQGIAAGDVDMHSAVLWARVDRPGPVVFQVDTTPTFSRPFRIAFDVVRNAEPAKAEVRGLRPGTRYWYRAFAGAQATASGTFRTAASPGRRQGLTFGVTGDWRGELAPYPAVANVTDRLDFFVALGDTIYADFPSPAVPSPQATTLGEFRAKHAEVYTSRFGLNTLADVRSRTAWFAMLDDHEVTNDFAGGPPPATDSRFLPSAAPFINETDLYRRALLAFRDYNPIADERWKGTGDARLDGKPRLYRSRRFGDDAAMFVVDARSFRDTELPAVANPTDPAQVFGFMLAAADPTRTLLGRPQLVRLEQDLLAAQRAGVTWKFVLVPEPIQNLGVLGASDRFEGYAAERNALLAYIANNAIRNVVFVAADLHGTLVNNLTWQTAPGTAQIPTDAFEVITGSVAFDAPLGPSLIEIAAAIGLITPAQQAFYATLPRAGKDAFLENLINGALQPLGYDLLGLQGSPIHATLQAGSYTCTHTFGWTEFAIDATTQALTVTTWGIDPYSEAQLLADPAAITARTPQVVQQFVVQPQ